jgi:uncharacterized membrane protein
MQNVTAAKKHKATKTFQIAAAAIFAALVAVATMTLSIPIPATAGYFNLGEALIYVAALLFGPFIGLIAGAGAAIADMTIAPLYAPATLFIKATEGFLVGYLTKKLGKKIKNLTLCASIAILIGGLEMVFGYFIFQSFIKGYSAALMEIPVNISQMLLGLIIAVPIMHAVLHVFPQFKNYFQEIQS